MVPVLDDLREILERQLLRAKDGVTGWMFGPRKHPITKETQIHNGVDLGAPEGTEIKAPLSGVVAAAWLDDKYGGGNSLVIDHARGPFKRTGYAHMHQPAMVRPGDKVSEGQVIGLVGSTGKSTGPHLHFVVRKMVGKELKAVDPLPDLCVLVGVVEMPEHQVLTTP